MPDVDVSSPPVTCGPHHGRVAVVTGAGGGLGRAVVKRLASGGALVACGDRDRPAAEHSAALVVGAGGVAVGYELDVTSEVGLQSWRDAVERDLGRPAIVVNVAGILDRRQLDEVDLDAYMKVLRVNLGGTYACIRTFVPDLLAAGWGRIVNIGSIAAMTGYPYPAYGSSKAGVVNLTRSLLVDLWGTAVTINAVCPGAMDTPMMKHEAAEAMRARTPAARIVTPDEVASLVDFLCTEAAASINGAAIVVDGGATALFRYFED